MSTFSNSQSIGQLKAKGIYVNVVKNPKTEKFFLTDDAGNQLGAISESCVAEILKTKTISDAFVLSDFTDDNGVSFKMLHMQANNNVIASSRPSTVTANAPAQPIDLF